MPEKLSSLFWIEYRCITVKDDYRRKSDMAGSHKNGFWSLCLYIGWQWRNFFIPYLCQLFSRHDVGQALRMFVAMTYQFLSKIVIIWTFSVKPTGNNATNFHHRTTQRSYCDHGLLWRQFVLRIHFLAENLWGKWHGLLWAWCLSSIQPISSAKARFISYHIWIYTPLRHRTCNQIVKVSACEGIDRYTYT